MLRSVVGGELLMGELSRLSRRPKCETAGRRNLKSLVESKKSVYLQHDDVMPKGNGFYELGIQPSLNAFFFSQEDPKPRDVVQ